MRLEIGVENSILTQQLRFRLSRPASVDILLHGAVTRSPPLARNHTGVPSCI